MYVLRLELYLEEPLLISSVASGEENSGTALNYIPGSTLHGACVRAYLKRHHTDDLADDEQARRLFFEDELFFLNGYPAYPFNRAQRALPRPLSWHMDKGTADIANREVRDYAWLPDVEVFEKSKVDSRSFFWPNGDSAYSMIEPPRWVNVHNASRDPMLKSETNSDVFRYDALARGQAFVAFVASQDESLLVEVEECLATDHLRLGGSQTAGYGLVSLRTKRVDNWSESEPDYDVEDVTIITLLSDAILRDENGHPTTDFPAVLRMVLERPDLPQPKVFSRTRLVGGFNRKWGLPLPQRWAVAMGSTYIYDAADLDVDELVEVSERGIGERRNVGFGRIGVNLNRRGAFATMTPGGEQPTKQTLSAASRDLAQEMARRYLLEQARTKILQFLSKARFEQIPENAQLSRLRLLVRQAQREEALSPLLDHLEAMKKPAREQFEQRRLRVVGAPRPSYSWAQWLRERAERRDGLTQIGLDPGETRWQLAGEAPVVDDELRLQVTCLLLEAILRKAVKEAQGD